MFLWGYLPPVPPPVLARPSRDRRSGGLSSFYTICKSRFLILICGFFEKCFECVGQIISRNAIENPSEAKPLISVNIFGVPILQFFAKWGPFNYFVLSSKAIASCRSVSASLPNGSNAATASSASFLANSFAFSIPTTAG